MDNSINRICEVMARLDNTFKVKLNEVKKSIKHIYYSNIEKDTLNNVNYRKVVFTGEHMQLVLMSIKPNEEIGIETHENIDQFFRFESGKGLCIINDVEHTVSDGDSIIVPAGSKHNIINKGKDDLKLYTIYSPPHHKDGIVFKTKESADKSKEKF